MGCMDYSPSAWPRRLLLASVAFVAVVISFYLALFEWQVIHTVWDPVFKNGTRNVLTSQLSHDFSKWIHIPDAFLGTLAYLADVIFALIGSTKRWKTHPWLVIIFGISVIPVGIVSIILVALQGLVVKSWCFLCFITASISLILIFLAYAEVMASCRFLATIHKMGSVSLAWKAFWGCPTQISESAAQSILNREKK